LDECGAEGPLVITRNGKPVAVLLVPFDDDDLERLMLGRSPRFQALLNRSRKSIEEGKGLSEEAFWGAVRKRAKERKATTAKGNRNKASG
jgi:PHD/YefM family antitoxin component YafN of YafNO toxin-antitoxin module